MKDLLIPKISDMPKWVNQITLNNVLNIDFEKINHKAYPSKESYVSLCEIFDSFNGIASMNVKRNEKLLRS